MLRFTCRGRQYTVDIKVKSCTGTRRDLSGIPCSHTIACMPEDRIAPQDMIRSYHSIESFVKAYGNIIVPSHDKKRVAKDEQMPIEPPLYVKKVGRFPKNKLKKWQEDVKAWSCHSLYYSHCRNFGHNKDGCPM